MLALHACVLHEEERKQQLEGCKDQAGNDEGPRLGVILQAVRLQPVLLLGVLSGAEVKRDP